MAKIDINNAGKYSSTGGDFFTLADDGDVARVRFLYDQPDGSDMDFYLVHEIKYKENGKERRRYISCLAVDDEGHMHPDDCPLCKAGYKTQEKLFLQLYDESDGKLKVWERGKNFVGKIVSFLNRYGALVTQPIEIERKGKKGDTNTTYEMFALEKDNGILDDFPPKTNIEGTLIIRASKSDMLDIIDGVYDFSNNNHEKDSSEPRREPERVSRRETRPRDVRGTRQRVDDTF